MAFNAVQTRHVINEDDLKRSTPERKYPMGMELRVTDSDDSFDTEKVFIYAKVGVPIQYRPTFLDIPASAGGELTNVNSSTRSGGALIGIAQVPVTAGEYAFFQVKGSAKVNIGAETYAINDGLEVVAASSTVAKVDGSSGSTILSTSTFAVSREAGTAAKAIDIYMKGWPVEIKAT